MLAPNPGPFTGPGTNTYLVGPEDEGVVAVIDPGPLDRSHEGAILRAVGERRVAAVVVTHTHEDHAPLANPLAAAVGAPAYGHAAGPAFDPDLRLADGDSVPVGSTRLVAVHTPGHSRDHLCLRAGTVLFTGDHIMGGSSVMVDDLVAYLASLRRLQTLTLERLYPGHGPEIGDPVEVISWYLEHRRQREEEIRAAVEAGAGTVGAVVETVYREVDPALHPLAARSVAAHLRKLAAEGVVVFAGKPSVGEEWQVGEEWDEPVASAR